MKLAQLFILGSLLIVVSPAQAQNVTPRGDTIVKLAGAPRYPGMATLVNQFTVGASSTAPQFLFNVITEMLVTRTGNVWVLDSPARSPSIRIFDSTGKFVRAVGRPGDGPGEFRAPGSIAELPDGRVAVRDILGHKINVYTASGEPAATWKFPMPMGGVAFSGGLVADSAGYLYVYINLLEGPNLVPPPGADGSAAVRFTPAGAVIDTINKPNPDFSARPGWRISPRGYLVTGLVSRYAIDLRIPPSAQNRAQSIIPTWLPGDPVVSIRRNVATITLSGDERADRNRMMLRDYEHDHPTSSRIAPAVPATKTPIQSFSVDRDGRIWVRRSVASERYNPPPAFYRDNGAPRYIAPWREPLIYDVFEPSGAFIGSARIPYDVTVIFGAVRGNVAWGHHSDADGVQYVRRMRIVSGCGRMIDD